MSNTYAIDVNKDSVIIHTISGGTIEQASKVHKMLNEQFPENTVITLPDDNLVHSLDRESAIEFLNYMLGVLKNRED